MHSKSLIFIFSGLVLFACGPDPAFVRAPFAGVSNQTVEQVMDAATGGVLSLGNGTEIHVPAHAFVNHEGQPVSGAVTIAYTEIDEPASILISGIPLNYGDKSNPSVMESAGMFDLSASAQGQPVELGEGKSIKTIISSNVEGDKYDFFQLNAEGNTWNKLGSTEPVDNPAIDSLTESIAAAESASEAFDLTNCFSFNYGYELDIIERKDRYKLKDKTFNYYTWDTAPAEETLRKILKAKLKSYGVSVFLKERGHQRQGVYWNGRNHNPNLLLWKSERPIPNWIVNSEKYRNPRIEAIGKGRYRLTFMRWEYKDGEWTEYTDFTTYMSPRMTLAELYANAPAERSAEYEALLAQAEQEKETLAAQNKVLREFNISKMGVYNYDYIKEEERLMVEAEIYLDGQPLEDMVTDLFVMIKDENAVLRYAKSGLDHFVIYPGQQVFAFMVVGGNGIAMQSDQALNDLDVNAYRANPDQVLRIDLMSTDYEINRPIDLAGFLDQEMNGISTGDALSMN